MTCKNEPRKFLSPGTTNDDTWLNKGDMIEVIKILNNKQDAEVSLRLERNNEPIRRKHIKLAKTRCTRRLQMYFPSRIMDVWNSLPNGVIKAFSILSLEKHLDHY